MNAPMLAVEVLGELGRPERAPRSCWGVAVQVHRSRAPAPWRRRRAPARAASSSTPSVATSWTRAGRPSVARPGHRGDGGSVIALSRRARRRARPAPRREVVPSGRASGAGTRDGDADVLAQHLAREQLRLVAPGDVGGAAHASSPRCRATAPASAARSAADWARRWAAAVAVTNAAARPSSSTTPDSVTDEQAGRAALPADGRPDPGTVRSSWCGSRCGLLGQAVASACTPAPGRCPRTPSGGARCWSTTTRTSPSPWTTRTPIARRRLPGERLRPGHGLARGPGRARSPGPRRRPASGPAPRPAARPCQR